VRGLESDEHTLAEIRAGFEVMERDRLTLLHSAGTWGLRSGDLPKHWAPYIEELVIYAGRQNTVHWSEWIQCNSGDHFNGPRQIQIHNGNGVRDVTLPKGCSQIQDAIFMRAQVDAAGEPVWLGERSP